MNERPLAESTPAPAAARKGPKPKYHTSMTGRGVTAGTARPRFSSSSEDEVSSNDSLSDDQLASSDLDTDFSADEMSTANATATTSKRTAKPTAKVAALRETLKEMERLEPKEEEPPVSTPTLKLKIKLPPTSSLLSTETASTKSRNINSSKKGKNLKSKKQLKSSTSKTKKSEHYGFGDYLSANRKKSTDTWSTSKREATSSTSDSDEDDDLVMDNSSQHFDDIPTTDNAANEKLYCVCQCPHDDVSEMIGCDAPGICQIRLACDYNPYLEHLSVIKIIRYAVIRNDKQLN